MASKWSENPNHGTFNPATVEGRKIFEKKSKGPPDEKQISLLKKDAPALWTLLEGKVSDFGPCVLKVPVKYNGNNPVEFVNLVTHYHSVSLERIKQEALRVFGTPVLENDPIPGGQSN